MRTTCARAFSPFSVNQEKDEEVVFAHGEITKTISIPLFDDDVFNEDKIFEVMLSEATAGSTLGKSKCTIVTILNDDGKSGLLLFYGGFKL